MARMKDERQILDAAVGTTAKRKDAKEAVVPFPDTDPAANR